MFLALEVMFDSKSKFSESRRACKDTKIQLFFKLSYPDQQCESARSKTARAKSSDAW